MSYKKSTRLLSLCAAATIILGESIIGLGFSATKSHAQEVDGPSVTWLVSLWGPRRGQTEGLEKMRELLAERTGGRFNLDLQYGEVLSGPRENLQGIQAGAFEMAMFCTGYDQGKAPATSGLELPFSPTPTFLSRAKWEENYIHQPAILTELAKWNAYPIIMGTLPPQAIMGKGTPPKSVADLEGLRVNALTSEQPILGPFGMTLTTIPSVEMFQAMDRGVIDAVTNPWTYALATYRIHEVATWYSRDFGALSGRNACPIVANTAAYEELPQQYKDLIEEVKPEAYRWQAAAYEAADVVNVEEFNERGLVEVRFPPEQLKILHEEVREKVWNGWIEDRKKQGLPAEDLAEILEKDAGSY